MIWHHNIYFSSEASIKPIHEIDLSYQRYINKYEIEYEREEIRIQLLAIIN